MKILIWSYILFFKTLRICYFIDVNILKRKAYDAVNWSYKLMYHVIVTYIVGLKGLNGTKGLNLSWRRGEKREMSTDCKYDWSAKNNIFSALIYATQRRDAVKLISIQIHCCKLRMCYLWVLLMGVGDL